MARRSRRPPASGWCGRCALRDSPTKVAVSPDPYSRLEMGFDLFTRIIVDMGQSPAGAKRGGCVLAVAAFQPPGECVGAMLPERTRRRHDPGPDATDMDRWLYLGTVMADHDLLEEHVHVGPVGVDPGFQGRGIGHAVMGLLCDRFDERREVAWLETDKPENVRFYLSLGFEVAEEVPLIGDTVRQWFMRRDPR